MKIDPTKRLFGSFPRTIRKWRKEIKNMNELKQEVRNGAKHISIYDKNLNIDKVILDIDTSSIEESFEIVGNIMETVRDENLNYIPVFSGRRGFHLYILFNVHKAANEETARFVVKSAQKYFITDENGIDESIIGGVKHLIRIPNTKREDTGCYCSYLPKEFDEWNPLRIVEYSKEPHEIIYDFGNDDGEIKDFADVTRKRAEFTEEIEPPRIPQHGVPRDVKKFLGGLIRPCLISEIFGGKPSHKIRTELGLELKYLGYDIDVAVEIIRRLNWTNFDENMTRYHLEKLYKSDLKPMSNETLRGLGLNPKWRCYPWRKRLQKKKLKP